jgi:hypothetical protein
MKAIVTVVLSLLITGTVFAQACKDLPDNFSSYNQAIKAIKIFGFKISDKLPYGKSSWITSATYYSCDGTTGYLVYSTYKGREYIHEKVPFRVWIEFKNASSSGSYYNYSIKGRYRLVPQ